MLFSTVIVNLVNLSAVHTHQVEKLLDVVFFHAIDIYVVV